jgi:hypothetical protein
MTEQTQISPRQSILPPITDPTVHAEIDRLARRYLAAGGIAMEVLNAVGGKAEGLVEKLPQSVRGRCCATGATCSTGFCPPPRARWAALQGWAARCWNCR